MDIPIITSTATPTPNPGMADPITFPIFSQFFGPFWGAPGALALYFRIPLLPLHVPIFFPTFKKKSHPEEIPRKKSKTQDRPKLATYYIQLLLLLLLCAFIIIIICGGGDTTTIITTTTTTSSISISSSSSSSSSSSICTKLVSVSNILQ